MWIVIAIFAAFVSIGTITGANQEQATLLKNNHDLTKNIRVLKANQMPQSDKLDGVAITNLVKQKNTKTVATGKGHAKKS
jgi:hypothetical protein